ncbi:hypothetical protein [Streptomyces afghaniensis]|uniref:hypothetical protein n=1 Tax=Streptomyces afghaniensis TaxID=66865 RepID=UPI00277D6421|nr:hypothetical protein [Streptomyces afghaniensis]MDQ1022196.1 hypothetical protein [Streptomyces afghaniensis]
MTDTVHAGLMTASQLAADRGDGSNFATYFNTLLIVGITTTVIVRQFAARTVTKRMYFWVGVLILRGCVPPGPAELQPASIVLLVLSLLLSIAFGAWRGAVFPMWEESDGRVLRKGDSRILVLWVATVAVRLVFGTIGAVAFHEDFNTNALWLGMGVTLAVQHGVMMRRRAEAPLRGDQAGTTELGSPHASPIA